MTGWGKVAIVCASVLATSCGVVIACYAFPQLTWPYRIGAIIVAGVAINAGLLGAVLWRGREASSR